MAPKPRSRKARIAAMCRQLQAQGQDMTCIAERIACDERVTPRAAWRLACGLSQQQVADRYNTWFPPGSDTALITAKQLSYWETWPQSGREPSVTALTRLARIYGCTISALIIDHETAHGNASASTTQPADHSAATGDGTAGTLPAAPEARPWRSERWGNSLVDVDVDVPLGTEPASSEPGPQWAPTVEHARVQAATLWASGLRERRNDPDVLAGVGTVVLRWLHAARDEPTARSGGSRLAETADVERLRLARSQIKSMDDGLGGGAALPMAAVYLRGEVAPLLQGRYEERTGRALLDVAAAWSLDVGWMAYDAGDQVIARDGLISAVRLAHAAGNRLLACRALCAMSHQALELGDVQLGIGLAQLARKEATSSATPRMQAMLAAMEACEHAREGNRAESQSALDAAEQALAATSSQDGDPDWLDFDEGGLWGHAARAYRDLAAVTGGDRNLARQAQKFAEESLGLCRMTHCRTRAQRRAILAAAWVELGEIEQASAVATQVVVDAWNLHSGHVYREVQKLNRAITPTKSRAGAAFTERAGEYLHVRRPVAKVA